MEKIININEELTKLLIDGVVSVEIGDKWYSIPLEKLHLKHEQIYKFKGNGISIISEKDIYNISSVFWIYFKYKWTTNTCK